MKQPSIGLVPRIHRHERVVVQVDSLAARCVGALGVLVAACWLIAIFARDRRHEDWQDGGGLVWSLTMLAAVALIARGIYLGRPVTAVHAMSAGSLLVVGLGAHVLAMNLLGQLLIAGSGLALMWPMPARARPEDLPRVWALVDATQQDPLAPFVMQTGKCYHFNDDATAALAYRTRFGFAVVSGDPIGDEKRFPALVADFAAVCHSRGWRMVVLGCSERRLALWTPSAVGQSLRPIPIGRDVVVDATSFELVGRRFRNLRQAVNRTHNAGITTEIVAEQDLDAQLRAELTAVLLASAKGAHTDRGFCMNLDGVLEGRYPGTKLIIARDADGIVQGFHRYATAGAGADVTLDVPWRRRGSPNGIDERLSVDMINAAKEQGAQRVSLAFAAFPELFGDDRQGWFKRCCYVLIHVLDPLIALESLARYLHKFHAEDARRYALLSLTQIVPLAFVLLSLEFMPRRRQL
ncbi:MULTISPECIES: bifunctional lysylphosphatidylglycerol flippase/synthetase MprF [unclassified Mycobacterium]|uniref:bifunctional lysylphosphatidylglycerol flippase/synthetase MprF n=1 Tax=unclassified Mycobacterium TaxID=2642494 RepID=UPI002740B4C3|nr:MULTISPECIES: phosphatidylglycerol lysyltransferase domain-containing protein [unclassified Mycobacterium]MDP7702287.1 phosphatidylglycerol lysyltransferase domain-containing protein [Mycobacterium sp. TY815]MDP7720781.1 phosphatidylglycerol lysyltransferase domain-containing protein [Mycobacterium sp. TY814]